MHYFTKRALDCGLGTFFAAHFIANLKTLVQQRVFQRSVRDGCALMFLPRCVFGQGSRPGASASAAEQIGYFIVGTAAKVIFAILIYCIAAAKIIVSKQKQALVA